MFFYDGSGFLTPFFHGCVSLQVSFSLKFRCKRNLPWYTYRIFRSFVFGRDCPGEVDAHVAVEPDPITPRLICPRYKKNFVTSGQWRNHVSKTPPSKSCTEEAAQLARADSVVRLKIASNKPISVDSSFLQARLTNLRKKVSLPDHIPSKVRQQSPSARSRMV